MKAICELFVPHRKMLQENIMKALDKDLKLIEKVNRKVNRNDKKCQSELWHNHFKLKK